MRHETRYEVRSGRRTVALKEASTAREALLGYLRGLGCRDDELVWMGTDAMAWWGAVFRAQPAADKRS